MTTDDDFHDQAAIAALQGELANPNLCHADPKRVASSAARHADALCGERDRRASLSFTAAEALRRNGRDGHER
jgi:hypothetical protein